MFVANPNQHILRSKKKEGKALEHPYKEDSYIILNADKGVTLVIMEMDRYIDKCTALQDDENVYKNWKDQTKSINS